MEKKPQKPNQNLSLFLLKTRHLSKQILCIGAVAHIFHACSSAEV